MTAEPEYPPTRSARRTRWILGFSLGLNTVLLAVLGALAAMHHNPRSAYDGPRREIEARVELLLDRVALPADQHDRLRLRFLSTFDQIHERMGALHRDRRRLTRAVILDPEDDAAALQLRAQMEKLHTQMDEGALATLRDAARTMTPEQRERFADAIEEMMPGARPRESRSGS